MNIKELIDAAKNNSGMQLGQIAEEMHIPQARISEWKKGKYRPGASQIIYLADKAKLPAIETLAQFEAETNPDMASFWKKAVSELRQNQGLSRFKMTKIKGPIGPFSFGLSVFQALVYFRKPVGALVW